MVSNRVGNARLLKLAKFLARLPPERFDYSRWVGADWKGKQDLSCGTSGCALGWASTMPAFRRLGLHLRPLVRGLDAEWSIPEWGQPRVGRSKGQYAGRAIFGRGADVLFLPDTYIPTGDFYTPGMNAPPKSVAACIRKFVKARGN